MLEEGRPSRAAKDAVLNSRLRTDGTGAQAAPAAQQVSKQARITDTFPVRKGPAAPHKNAKTTAVATPAPKSTATERTKARAARTSVATQAGSTRGRKRRNPPRTATDDENDLQDDDGWKPQQQQQEVKEVTATVGAIAAFLFGEKILGLARVTGWERDQHGEVHVIVRHYKKPEETHLGRQSHHHSREVFLGVVEHTEPVGCIWGHAYVVPPDRFASTSGTDVYICEYEYDDKWKRFRRCLDTEDGLGAASDDDDEWGAAAAAADGRGRRRGSGAAVDSNEDSSSSGEDDLEEEESDRDVEYKPRNTLDGWVIRKPRPGQARPPTRNGGRSAGRAHCYKAIIDENGSGLLLDQGAAAVPDRGPVGQLAAARRALALNNCSGGLPCRENEKQALRRFIGQAVEEGGDSPGVLYICGVPGTGKTACVMEVLGGVRAAAQSSGVQLVILNALQLPTPQHVYSKLWERMSGQRWGPARALKALEESFSGGARRHMTLLIVDEIDVLITRDQAVLYNLFEWPMREGSRLAVIGISNTHDLDSRVLPRIASRLSGSKLAFNPYNCDQLREILNSRLQGVTAVAKPAVEFCARKVASTTGDVRRALELLRRATEIAETELALKQQQQHSQQVGGGGAPPPLDVTNAVGARQAHAAIKEMYGSIHMTLLRSAGLYQKLVLAALVVEVRAQSKLEVTLGALHHRLTTHLALLMKDAALPLSRAVEAAAALGAQRLVLAEAGWQGPGMKLALNVPLDDLVEVLRADPALAPWNLCPDQRRRQYHSPGRLAGHCNRVVIVHWQRGASTLLLSKDFFPLFVEIDFGNLWGHNVAS
ncbi:origin recognition complex subunit 1 [Volvox carteri f. nagariensis]|uniref:Origin recognition complex subunit 1 n=1 Tax=Volvox carteri f. nagariensis TaxID=3068 RepID=D8TYM7_VOLCA|nr:origin recognition complex subunit 1 [Volvox carteri f. nagariensis]EFJ47339.1 origin recognition complex subunit 1 [Volvox carteri f. nagariensis]|eukprot:XP_002951528.1 origin recognition complex subunit 1 [Volvox carteri f. nagariensis]